MQERGGVPAHSEDFCVIYRAVRLEGMDIVRFDVQDQMEQGAADARLRELPGLQGRDDLRVGFSDACVAQAADPVGQLEGKIKDRIIGITGRNGRSSSDVTAYFFPCRKSARQFSGM